MPLSAPVKTNPMGLVGGLGMGSSLARQVYLMIMYFSFPEFPPPHVVLANLATMRFSWMHKSF